MNGKEPLTRPEEDEPGQGLDPDKGKETEVTTISEPVPQPKTRRPERR